MRRGRFRAAAALFAALALAACGKSEKQAASAEPPVAASVPSPCESRSFEGTSFTVCTFDSRADGLQLRWKGKDGEPLRSFERLGQDLGTEASRIRFAMNAGMYDESGAPIGLYVERGERLKKLNLNDGPGNFHMKPNGVFAVDRAGTVSVTPSSRFSKSVPNPVWATQSGPMLVIDGAIHPRFDANGESRLVRNGVGVRDGHTALFAISEEGVSFGRFARLFRDALDCPNALFLDGSVSSLWDPANERRDAYSRLGPMIVVLMGDAETQRREK